MKPDHSQLFFLLAQICGPVAVCVSAILAVMVYRVRRDASRSVASTSEMTGRVADIERKLDEVVRQGTERACRIAWLEARVRRERTEEAPASDPEPANAGRLSMTERRHRVLSLARRGMDTETIAETVGIPYGEVELIISLGLTVWAA